jgi:hypothetical protein
MKMILFVENFIQAPQRLRKTRRRRFRQR